MTIPTLSAISLLGAGTQTSLFGNPLVMIGALILMMYFLMIRPQQKQRKAQEAKIAAMKKGDKVVTIGGLHSTIHHISEQTVTLKLSEGIFVPFSKSAIQTVTKPSSGKDSPTTDQPAADSK